MTTAEGKQRINVLLASTSIFRQALFKRVLEIANESGKYNFQQVETKNLVPDIDEKAIRRPDHADLTKAITTAKTNKILEMLGEMKDHDIDLVVCGDQVIGFNGQIREKPESELEAKETLQSYGNTGHPAEAFSCIEVTNLKTGKRFIEVGLAKTFFGKVPDDVAAKLIAKREVLVCAGSFVIEDELLKPYIERIEGEIETMQGMPKTLVKELLFKALE